MSSSDRLARIAGHLSGGPRSGSSWSTSAASDSADDVVIVCAVRTPICRARKGGFRHITPDALLSQAFLGAMGRVPGLDPAELGDVCVGNVLQPGGGAAMARAALLMAGIPETVPLSTVNRQCSSGLQAVAHIAHAIRAGTIDCGMAAGVESMSTNSFNDARPDVDWESVKRCRPAADCMIPMGVTSEHVARKFRVSRRDQDAFALESHRRAARAQEAGLFDDEIVPVVVPRRKKGARRGGEATAVVRDDGIRPDTSLEQLAALRPVFARGGTTTAGNSSQVSDGAAAVILTRRAYAAQRGWKVMAAMVGYAVVGVPPRIMGIGPAVAIPAALARAGLRKDEVDVYEINEAFASQALYCVRELGLDPGAVNPNGGAIALGHPLGMTGARQVATLLYELERRDARTGVVSMCVGTGMGAAAVFRR